MQGARDHVTGSDHPARLLQSPGQCLPLRSDTASFLVIGNGIHNFSNAEKADLLTEAFRVLRGAQIFFNSSLYGGAIVEGTEHFWMGFLWVTARKPCGRRARSGLPDPEQATRPDGPGRTGSA